MYNYLILTVTGNVGFNFKLFYNAIKIGTWCSVVKDHMPKVVLSWFIALTRTTETLIEKLGARMTQVWKVSSEIMALGSYKFSFHY